MRLTVLGSGGAVPHPRRRPPAYLLQQGDWNLLLDAGPGTLSTVAALGLRPADLDAVLITHLHPDHSMDLVPLLFHRSWAPEDAVGPGLTLAGPPGFRAELSEWLEAVYPPALSGTNEDLQWLEIADGGALLGPWQVEPVRALHRQSAASESKGYRIEGDQGLLGYTGDTGPHDGLRRLLEPHGCLLCECGSPEGLDMPSHMTPSRIRHLVDTCPPALTLLTHIHEAYDRLPLPGPAFDGYGGRVQVAEDGMQVVWEPDGIRIIHARAHRGGSPGDEEKRFAQRRKGGKGAKEEGGLA